eukprot:3153715-Rhodomonas_salina.1
MALTLRFADSEPLADDFQKYSGWISSLGLLRLVAILHDHDDFAAAGGSSALPPHTHRRREEARPQLLGLPGACSSPYQASTPAFTPQQPQHPPDAPEP